jgi:hypothetical protein
MIQKYSAAMEAAIANGRHDWVQVQRWIERFICGTSAHQSIVGKRDHPDGGKVTQEQFDRGDKVAHVCPFVRDAIDLDLFYINESNLTQPLEIRKFLLARAEDFKKLEPAYDPLVEGKAATMPTGLKVLVTLFPKYASPTVGPDPAIDRIFQWMIIPFIRQGLMLGQFYKGCAEPAIHNDSWRKVLTSPYLAWVIRYMQPHDKLFVKPGTPGYPIYEKFMGINQQPIATTP